MELVRLSRAGAEPWGFRLVGGADYSTPLTVVKVSAGSPAERAGLSHGDVVRFVGGADAGGLTHDAAKAAVAAAGDVLELGVVRGLYDPVLDDFDPIYEPIDQDDFDQPSQPTEVFQIKQFTDTPDFSDNPTRSRTGSSGNPDVRFSETRDLDRSYAESPFVLPSKPYRPFSTEPTPVPPLEEPIILNPEYHDEFGKIDEGVNGFRDGVLGETRFKLPISEQYDPDGTRLKKSNEAKVSTTVGNESVERISEVKMREETMIKEQKEEIKFMEKMKKEIDLDRIEMTAASIVDESIEKAVNVADEIKKEMDLELSSINSEFQSTTKVSESKSILKTKKEESIKEVNNLISKIDESTNEDSKMIDVSVAKGVAKFESVENHGTSTAQKVSTKQELEETIVTGSVRSKSEMYEKDVKETDFKSQRKAVEQTNIEKYEIKTDINKGLKEVSSRVLTDSNLKSEKISKSEITTKSDEKSTKESKYTTAKLLAEQRAYTIGLQTIPHIKGTVQSSYHYDLLLKTFFIHLTDVMVALSRFILAEPVLSKPLEAKETSKVDERSTEMKREMAETTTESTIVKQTAEKIEKSNQLKEIKTQGYADLVDKVIAENENREKKCFRTGAEMAQLTEKRSEELIHKMDGVITEFQTKAGLEEEIVSQRERRSRSRSKIREDVVNESDPLESLSKVDKKTSEITEVTTSSNTLSTEMKTELKSESTEITRETTCESKESNQDGKNTYIAIVEAHVYTNKNAILDKMLEMSETNSKQSSVQETSVDIDVNKTVTTQHVAVESLSREQIIEPTEKAAKEITKEEKHEVITDSQGTVEVDTQQIKTVETVQPIVELQEDIAEKTNVTIEVKDKIDIQEIQSSEYVGEVNIINEESVQTVQLQDVDEVTEVQDLKIADDIVKIEEIVSVATEIESQAVRMSEETVTMKEESLSITNKDKKETRSVKITEGRISLQEEFVSIGKDERAETQDVHISEDSTKEQSISISAMNEFIKDVKVADETTVIKETTTLSDTKLEIKDESAQLKVTKEEITEMREDIEVNQEIEVNIKKSVQICESENKYQLFTCETSTDSKEFIQEASFTAKSSEDMKKLTLDTNLRRSDSETSVKSTIDTPTPSTVPPTPLTDEYVFRLQIPMPKITGPPIPRSPSPEDEDPHIVKKNLIPHIDTEIIEEVVYDTPLPTPPADKVVQPVYTKPGLKGGNLKSMFKKEEILEIERKSSLLASAIDQTIKSIEEYKEEVGIDTKPERPLVYNGYAKVIETRLFNGDTQFNQANVEQQVIRNTDSLNKIVENKENIQTGLVNRFCEKPTQNQEGIIQNQRTEASESKMDETEGVVEVDGYRPVPFNPDDAPHLERVEIRMPGANPTVDPGQAFVAEDGGIIGTHQGIVDGLEEAVVDEELAKEQGKPGMTEDKIAELISGESEMLREAHVMGLTRVLKSHMHRNDDDSSVDFKKIKPIVESLKDSEVLKALNEEFTRTLEEKKKEERKWTKFLQKPSRPVPRAKFGYHGYVAEEENLESQYKVKIVKQPKPKIAPDYKPEDFNTGPLPWEERALKEPPPPPVEPEDPILVPEEQPQFLEAIDNLPESEVPDLEETGIPLPPEKPAEEPKPEPEEIEAVEEAQTLEQPQEAEEEKVEEETNKTVEMEENRVAEQLMKNVEGMVDPNAPLEQQLAQMRAQLAALARLPGVIQQTLELVTRQLCHLTQQESQQPMQNQLEEAPEATEESNENSETIIEDVTEEKEESGQVEEVVENGVGAKEEVEQREQVTVSAEEIAKMRREEEEILGEQRRIEKQKKCSEQELMAELHLDQESRKLKQRPTPPAGKPKPVFGPLTPAERPLVLPGGRKWRKPKDAYNEQFIAETLTAQAEIIQGKAMGKTYESVHLPYDERVNFMKYEKPPVSLDHLQHSDVYKLIHDMEQAPPRRVDMLTPVIAEADYREKCRSMTPCADRIC